MLWASRMAWVLTSSVVPSRPCRGASLRTFSGGEIRPARPRDVPSSGPVGSFQDQRLMGFGHGLGGRDAPLRDRSRGKRAGIRWTGSQRRLFASVVCRIVIRASSGVNRACPTRTRVAPSSTAIAKSRLIPMTTSGMPRAGDGPGGCARTVGPGYGKRACKKPPGPRSKGKRP